MRRMAMSPAMSPSVGTARTSGLFDPAYYEEIVAKPFREGVIDEAPVIPGTGMFMPAGTAAAKDKGIFRRNVPIFDPTSCTACMECTIACPDNAIPNAGHEISDLLKSAINVSGLVEAKRATWYDLVPAWSDEVRRLFVAKSSAGDLAAVATQAASALSEEPLPTAELDQIVAAIASFPVARTRPIFDAEEKRASGSGALYSVTIDPWKCTGCMQCVEVCGPNSLTSHEQDDELLEMLEGRFERLTTLPDTPARITATATAPGGDIKRILLARDDYYSITGGHGACRGCGEVTAIHLFNSLSHRIGEDQRQAHMRELDGFSEKLAALVETLPERSPRRVRVEKTMAELDQRLYLYESGPTGNGPSPTVIANSTGCSSVYASTMPFTPYLDPWVNGLFQDAQPLAVGIYEGLVSGLIDEVRALRLAQLELDGAYDPSVHDAKLATLSWRDFTPAERALVPAVVTISGDGAAYDIGFGAMSRVLAAGTPIKSLVLDTGGYSNTGGQASTASYSGQDADLARYGATHAGKQESRKELGLLAAFHPNVYVCSTSTAYYGHFLRASGDMLGFDQGTSLMVVYTPCDTENGMPEDLANSRSRLAVDSRVSPAVHPRPAQRGHDHRAVQHRRESRAEQPVDDHVAHVPGRGRQGSDHEAALHPRGLRDRRGAVRQAVPLAGRARGGRGDPDRRVRRAPRGPAGRAHAVRVHDRPPGASGQDGLLRGHCGDGRGPQAVLADPAVPGRTVRSRTFGSSQGRARRADRSVQRGDRGPRVDAGRHRPGDGRPRDVEWRTGGWTPEPGPFRWFCGPRRERSTRWDSHHDRATDLARHRRPAQVQRLRDLLPGAAAAVREGDDRRRR